MDMLDIYTDYLICQNKYATATGLADMLDGDLSHDKVSRFLCLEDFGSKKLWQYVKPSVQERSSSDGVLILDDTIEDKPYTDENEVNC
ncbi:MAG: IS701 family transposase, partial [Legionellaceae bacterium]|nr:IS701 family transposase [Legionellaceae bacterium]